MLDHVIPEEFTVVDADEAEDRHARGDQCAEEGNRLADRPCVTRVQDVVALHPPQVEGQCPRGSSPPGRSRTGSR